jgi:hypothetical protein
MRLIGWLLCAALCPFVTACSGSSDAVPSDDVLNRLRASRTVDDAEAATCRGALRAVLPGKDISPPVLATDRGTYAEVNAELSSAAPAALDVIPQLPDDAAVTVCLLDARELRPIAPFKRSILAVSGDVFWWVGGRLPPPV